MARPRRTHPRLFIYNHPIRSLFELLGRHERAITFALGYTLYMCPKLLLELLSHIGYKRQDNVHDFIEKGMIRLEQPDDFGRTDVEVYVPSLLYLILEGKRGGPVEHNGRKLIFGINRNRAWQIVNCFRKPPHGVWFI